MLDISQSKLLCLLALTYGLPALHAVLPAWIAGGPAKLFLPTYINGIIPVLQALTRHCFCECFPFSMPKTKIAHTADAGELHRHMSAKIVVLLTKQTTGVTSDKAKVKNKI